jgi:hypothetical protein
MRYLFAAALVAAFASARAQVGFESFAGMGNPIWGSITSDGYDFNGGHFHTMDNDLGNILADSGSRVFMGHEGGDLGAPVTMTKNGGGLFSIFTIRAAELWVGNHSSYPNANYVQMDFTYGDASTETVYLVLDGLLDGDGGIDDFQQYYLNRTNIQQVVFNGVNANYGGNYAFGVDDITIVPEPSTLAVVGLGVLAALRRKRR